MTPLICSGHAAVLVDDLLANDGLNRSCGAEHQSDDAETRMAEMPENGTERQFRPNQNADEYPKNTNVADLHDSPLWKEQRAFKDVSLS